MDLEWASYFSSSLSVCPPMSSRSGIKATPEVVHSFNQAVDTALVITISRDSKQLVHDSSFSASSSNDTQSTLRAIQSHLSEIFPDPRYVIFTESESGQRIFISFVPDEAPVRLKMLFASTKNSFLQQLGSAITKKNILSFTELKDLEPSSFRATILLLDNSAVLTDEEKNLRVLDSLLHLSVGQNKELASVNTASPSSLFFQIDPELDSVLKSDLNSKLLVLSINTETEILNLFAEKANVSISDLIPAAQELISLKSVPAYLLYGYTPDRLVFVYLCASTCKVKARMLYAANKQGLLTHLKSDYFTDGQLDQLFEVGDLDELELSPSSSEQATTERKNSEIKFAKPKGPRRR